MGQKIILWSLAAEPLILGGLCYFLRRMGSLPPAGAVKSGELTLLIFAVISLSLVWVGSQFAAGRFPPRPRAFAPAESKPPFGQQIVAVALSTAPGVFGFAHYLAYGVDWVLPVFNLGAFAIAARHVLNFTAARP